MMPLAGVAVGRFAARTLVMIGFAFFAYSFYFSSTHLSPEISFQYNAFLRIIQVMPIPFAFISITNAAYVGLPREANNQVSGIVNFVRNVGGSILIALTGAGVVQRSTFHQARLQDFMQPGSAAYANHLSTLTGFFEGQTGNLADAHQLAQAMIYQQLNQQAAVMGYEDIYRVLGWASLLLVLFGFLLNKNKPGEGAPAGEAIH